MANNASSASLNMSMTPTVHVILNLISLTASSSGALLSFVILVGFLLRKKTFQDIPLLLCTNNYTLVFLLGIFELIHNIDTLRGDLGLLRNNPNILLCRIQAYIVFSLTFAVYLACALQAVFRLCRIVHPTRIWLLNPCTYLIIIPLMWITSFVLISPLYIRYGHELIPGEYICRITKDDTFSIAYATIIIYGIPFNAVAFTYLQVRRFIHRQTSTIPGNFHLRSRRRQRDIFVFRRIIIIVILLGSYGMPNSIMLIMLALTGQLVSSFYRVLEMSFAAAVLTLSVGLFYATPQLRKKIKLRPKSARLAMVAMRESNTKHRTRARIPMKTTTSAL